MVLKSRLKRLRFEADMSQEQLSNLSGIHISQISDYENNKIFPNTINLWLLAEALGCKVDDLYEKENQSD